METEIFKGTMVDFKKLEKYGFVRDKNIYIYSKIFMDSFKAHIHIDQKGIVSGTIFDLSAEEEYTNFRLVEPVGSFVNKVREEYKNILLDIRKNCFEKLYFTTNQANRITQSIIDLYHNEPEFPWEKSPGHGIFRNPDNEKWYALIMRIDKSKIEENSRGEVEVINVKLDPLKILDLVKEKGFYPSYHMNKKNWVTILLDGTVEDEKIMECIKESHGYTELKDTWIIPANPKFYDVIGEFNHSDTMLWKQPNSLKVGDIVYLYMASPYSALLYKCIVIETSIPHLYKDQNISMQQAMRIKKLEEYDKNEYPFSKLKEYGVRAIRGPRRMPEKLIKEMCTK